MKSFFIVCCFLLCSLSGIASTVIKGGVTDASNGEGIIGASVVLNGKPDCGAITDIDGNFSLSIPDGTVFPVVVTVNYIGYKEVSMRVNGAADSPVAIRMKSEDITMDEVMVTARRKTNSEAGILTSTRLSTSVTSGISGGQIAKTADSDAGEAVKRIPGVSLIDGRYIIVRGLSQRYNNVWINGGVAPSSEADGRAFSFDIIPSGSIDNIVVAKSYSADLPGDFCGGFIKIGTKGMPDKNSFNIGVGTGFNTKTHFREMRIGNPSCTDWLGVDNRHRTLSSDFPASLDEVKTPDGITYFTKNGFNNDWGIKSFRPYPDIKFNFDLNRRIARRVGVTLAANYKNENKTLQNVTNNRYGVYSATSDAPTIEKEYTDNQYSNNVMVSALNNWFFEIDPANRIEFRNMFSILGKNRLTERYGVSRVSGDYFEKQTELYYSSRMTYTGQLSGTHLLDMDGDNRINWTAGYAYANKNEPDRRIVSNLGGIPADGNISPDIATYNDNIKRYFQKLDDNVVSAAVDYTKKFSEKNIAATLKGGVYGEYRMRCYTPREFTYRTDNLSVNDRLYYRSLPFEEMMSDEWLGYDKVYADEITEKYNAYDGKSSIVAGYITTTLPIGKFNIDAGVRVEWWNMSIRYDRSMTASNVLMTENRYDEVSILPAVNMSYNFNEKHLMRLSYGRTVNRPEFREVSPSVYYDFDLFAEIQGNTELKIAEIDNIDLRYEFYPAPGETVSIGAFYKHFKNPIEWNFVDMGGSYRYSYENAKSAYVAGIEVDVRKTLDFVGVPDLAVVFNASAVLSRLKFYEGELVNEKDRPLQGQSPYIINAGLFYTSSNPKIGLSASLMYNIIGKRIIGVGKTTSLSGDTDFDLPDAYEMPRNLLDLSIAKKIGKFVEIKVSVKDILAQPVTVKQFPTVTINGEKQTREQTTYEYRPGTTFSFGISVKL